LQMVCFSIVVADMKFPQVEKKGQSIGV
jgi:hypothetical protein